MGQRAIYYGYDRKNWNIMQKYSLWTRKLFRVGIMNFDLDLVMRFIHVFGIDHNLLKMTHVRVLFLWFCVIYKSK